MIAGYLYGNVSLGEGVLELISSLALHDDKYINIHCEIEGC